MLIFVLLSMFILHNPVCCFFPIFFFFRLKFKVNVSVSTGRYAVRHWTAGGRVGAGWGTGDPTAAAVPFASDGRGAGGRGFVG